MKINELTAKTEKAIAKHNIDQSVSDDFAEFSFYGLRFENKVCKVGEVVDNSRSNDVREDEREFPEFGTEEYNEMPELDGASAWYIDENGTDAWKRSYKGRWQKDTDDLMVVTEHCYIIGGDVTGSQDYPDENEIVICDAIIVEILF